MARHSLQVGPLQAGRGVAGGGRGHGADGGAGRGQAELVKLRHGEARPGVAVVLDVEDDVGVGVGGQILQLGLAWLQAAGQRTLSDDTGYSVVLQARSVKIKHIKTRTQTFANNDKQGWLRLGKLF